MPKLFIEEYKKTLAGANIVVACREGILREFIFQILGDIKFLERQNIRTTLLHNIPNRSANRKYFRLFGDKLPNTRIGRIPVERGDDFYDYVLNATLGADKILFVERKYLTDENGRKLNSLTTRNALRLMEGKKIMAYGDLVANANFRSILEKICAKIETREVGRIHIVPAKKHCLKHELFSLEGVGTLIANNFAETLETVVSDDEVRIVQDLLRPYIKNGLIKPRSREHISAMRNNFHMAKIDGIPVGCVETIVLDSVSAELGALAVATRYRNQQVGFFLIQSFVEMAKKHGFKRVVSLTRNRKLRGIYLSVGFEQKTPGDLLFRQEKSPGVPMFVYSL